MSAGCAVGSVVSRSAVGHVSGEPACVIAAGRRAGAGLAPGWAHPQLLQQGPTTS